MKVYTLGRFGLVVDGKVLPSARKTRQKPLLLLKALIALGGREVPEEQLTRSPLARRGRRPGAPVAGEDARAASGDARGRPVPCFCATAASR